MTQPPPSPSSYYARVAPLAPPPAGVIDMTLDDEKHFESTIITPPRAILGDRPPQQQHQQLPSSPDGPGTFTVDDIYYRGPATFQGRDPLKSDIKESPDIKSVTAMFNNSIKFGNPNMLLRCRHLPVSTRNYIYRMRKLYPSIRLYVELVPLGVDG